MSTSPRSVLGGLALAAALVLGAPAAPARADEIDDQIANLKALDKSGDEAKVIAVMTELEDRTDSRVTTAFTELAKKSRSDKVAVAALRRAAKRKDEGLFKWLQGKLDDDKLAEKRPDLYHAVLEGVAEYHSKKVQKDLADVVGSALATDAEVATRAIRAYGSVAEKATVDQLIEWMGQTEATSRKFSDETRNNFARSKQAIIDTLAAMTGLDIADAGTWRTWWEENQKTFTFPDPNAPEVDVTKLEVYEDLPYGFTFRRPTTPGWGFEKADFDGARVRLVWKDDKESMGARADVVLFRTTGQYPDPTTLAEKYYVPRWRGGEQGPGEFEEFSKNGGEPALSDMSFGKRDWKVLKARGLGGADYKGWGALERRVYMHQPLPGMILFVEGCVRSGTDDAIKAEFWKTIEGIEFKK